MAANPKMSDLARRLIAKNKRTRATHLDLGNCDLNEVPYEITDLHWHESLTFASEWYAWDSQQ